MALVSIIVPVYNVEEYVEKCIQSVIGQTFADIEIILVNDGSLDGSGKICDEYAKKDTRVVCIHKPNGGLSDARNVGLSHATAPYVSFVDSDDWIEPDFIECLYNGCVNNDVMISCCGRFYAYPDYAFTKYTLKDTVKYTPHEAIKHMLKGDVIDVACWDKMFVKSLFDNYKFPKDEIHEDMAIMFDIFLETNGCVHVAKPLYHYRQRALSITKQKFSDKSLVIIKNINHVRNLLKDKPGLSSAGDAFYYRMLKNLCTVFYNAKGQNDYKEEFNSVKKELRNSIFKIFANGDLLLTDKLSALMVVSPFYVGVKKVFTAVTHKASSKKAN
ncbi:glycosyltransferase family 2 protein [Flavobacterium sp. RHBU_3]|uniref:glycosyltransferase family 2 protein n=1 Tax=Flavobacterium sp. RHBU_3 TaxID=3391184 RepID=UPI003984D45D